MTLALGCVIRCQPGYTGCAVWRDTPLSTHWWLGDSTYLLATWSDLDQLLESWGGLAVEYYTKDGESGSNDTDCVGRARAHDSSSGELSVLLPSPSEERGGDLSRGPPGDRWLDRACGDCLLAEADSEPESD